MPDLTIAEVDKMPVCDICGFWQAEYDARTKMGPWANMCRKCYLENRMHADLGMGKGQRLVLRGETICQSASR